jgi:hypothetical protein
VIIHSGHYRPVDAPDLAIDSPDHIVPPSTDVPMNNETKDAILSENQDFNPAISLPNEIRPISPKKTELKPIASIKESNPNQTSPQKISTILHINPVVRSPISASVEPVIAFAEPRFGSNILYPDHDLHATLRVLPKLIKYSGSTRNGLDSRGWGGSHDGESIQVVKVEKIERGSVGTKGLISLTYLGRKVFSKQWGELAKAVTKAAHEADSFPLENGMDYEDYEMYPDMMTVVYSQSEGSFSIKYNVKAMNEWPVHLLNLISKNKGLPSAPSLYTREELDGKETWPFWRIRMIRHHCSLLALDGSKYVNINF